VKFTGATMATGHRFGLPRCVEIVQPEHATNTNHRASAQLVTKTSTFFAFFCVAAERMRHLLSVALVQLCSQRAVPCTDVVNFIMVQGKSGKLMASHLVKHAAKSH
jgi:hypothetical protein